MVCRHNLLSDQITKAESHIVGLIRKENGAKAFAFRDTSMPHFESSQKPIPNLPHRIMHMIFPCQEKSKKFFSFFVFQKKTVFL
jgi:hypothetical protein